MLSLRSNFLRGLSSYGPNAIPQNSLGWWTSTPANRRFSSSENGASEFGKTHVARGVGRLSDAVIEHGKGSYLILKDDRGRYLDFTTGIGVAGLGHCHPKVSKAAAEQCFSLVHGQIGIAFHKPYLRLIEKLLPIMPHPSLDTFFFLEFRLRSCRIRREAGANQDKETEHCRHARGLPRSYFWCNGPHTKQDSLQCWCTSAHAWGICDSVPILASFWSKPVNGY